jgi:hypothetical protein
VELIPTRMDSRFRPSGFRERAREAAGLSPKSDGGEAILL